VPKPLCNPLFFSGSRTFFQSTQYGKGNRVSLPWLCYITGDSILPQQTAATDSLCRLNDGSSHAGEAQMAKNCGWPLGTRGGPQPTASKKRGPQVTQLPKKFC